MSGTAANDTPGNSTPESTSPAGAPTPSTPAAVPAAWSWARLFDALDDMANPIVVKELRQAVQSRLVAGALFLFLAGQLFCLGAVLLVQGSPRGTEEIDFRAGRAVFIALQAILLGTSMLFVPLYAGLRLAGERAETNVDLLFISTLGPGSIILGKFLSAVALIGLIFSACAPFMTFTYLLRGIDIPTILAVLIVDAVAVLLGTQVCLLLASVGVNRAVKAVLGLASFGALVTLYSWAMMITVFMVERGTQAMAPGWEFWVNLGLSCGGVGLLIGLFYVWSVALLSPASTNRTLPVRVYVAASWLLGGAGLGWLGVARGFHWAVLVWCFMATWVFAVHLALAVNEREAVGPRVARQIPRHPVARGVAFLFYTGSAGGVCFAVAGVLMTFVATAWWFTLYPVTPSTMPGAWYGFVLVCGVIFLYALAFSLSAVALRWMLLPRAVKPGFTVIIGLVLLAVLSVAPYLVNFLVNNDRPADLGPEWTLTNPFATITHVVRRPLFSGSSSVEDQQAIAALLFVGSWAFVAVAVNGPWFAAQIKGFRPYQPRRRGDETSKPAPGTTPEPTTPPDVLESLTAEATGP